MCQYLLRRCDNAPVPWKAGCKGDDPWFEDAKIFTDAPDVAKQRMEACEGTLHRLEGHVPFWGYDCAKNCWAWLKEPPEKKQAREKKQQKKETAAVARGVPKSCSGPVDMRKASAVPKWGAARAAAAAAPIDLEVCFEALRGFQPCMSHDCCTVT